MKIIANLLQEMKTVHGPGNASPRERILVKQGQRMIPMAIGELAYFFTRDRLVYACTRDNRHYLVDYTLDELEKSLDPKQYFRANRQFLVSFTCISLVNHYFNSKLKVALQPAAGEELIISREKSAEFRQWLGE